MSRGQPWRPENMQGEGEDGEEAGIEPEKEAPEHPTESNFSSPANLRKAARNL